MFKLKPNPTFRAKVSMPVPGEANGSHVVEFEFRHKTKSEVERYLKQSQGRNDGDALEEIIVGWSGVLDDNGAPVPYSRDALEQLLENYPGAGGALGTAYFAELAKAKLGN